MPRPPKPPDGMGETYAKDAAAIQLFGRRVTLDETPERRAWRIKVLEHTNALVELINIDTKRVLEESE